MGFGLIALIIIIVIIVSGIKVIPQIMSNKADEVIHLGKQLREYGYDEININFGCPSGTVSSKKRGSNE